MSFITIQQAEQIIGQEFAQARDKARLILLANTWMKNYIGFVPHQIDATLVQAAAEIIKGIMAKVIYVGTERLTSSERVKADSVEVEETFIDGSVAISEYEQIAQALIDALKLKNPHFPLGFNFEVFRV